jgi:hypothetical protein
MAIELNSYMWWAICIEKLEWAAKNVCCSSKQIYTHLIYVVSYPIYIQVAMNICIFMLLCPTCIYPSAKPWLWNLYNVCGDRSIYKLQWIYAFLLLLCKTDIYTWPWNLYIYSYPIHIQVAMNICILCCCSHLQKHMDCAQTFVVTSICMLN